MKKANFEKRPTSISTKTTKGIHSYSRQTKRLYGSRIYARGKERFHIGTDTKQKGAKRPNEQWGLNRFMVALTLNSSIIVL